MTAKLGILISGSGTNLQAIIDSIKKGSLKAEIEVVISNVQDAYGLSRAKKEGIPAYFVDHRKYKSRKDHEVKLIEILQNHGVDIVILAGYMRVITDYFISHYPNKILNIHPAILPCFKGVDAQKQAIDYGVKLSGATVHFVDEQIDHGPIIIQGVTIVKENDKRDELANRILKIEHRIFPQAISWLVEDRIQILGNKTFIKKTKNKKFADISDLHPCIINPPLEEGF
ncbi:phosphoribosylglycinamide formyltransferase [Desulfothermus naphthae]